MSTFKNIITKFNKAKILVVGDIMLDRHIIGSVSRISPEAPVPVVLEEKRFSTLGGAANVANNLRALGAQVWSVGKIGNDHEGKELKRELQKKRINIQGVFVENDMKTITKTRIIARHQQVVRVDQENRQAVSDNTKIKQFISENIDTVDAVIISDYGKGVITSDLVALTVSEATRKKKIITVDPKVEHFGYYNHVSAITPNKQETENAIRYLKIQENAGKKLALNSDRLETFADIERAGQQLLKYLNLESLLITLGEHGMRLFEKGKQPVEIPTHAQDVYDVTGAGDAVISVFTLGLVAGATKRQAAELANFAAGIVVGRMGAVAVKREELLAATMQH